MHNLATRVERVTVHRNGALVVRRGVATHSQVRVLGLPLLYSSDSLRVRTTSGTILDLRETAELLTTGGTTTAPNDDVTRQALLVESLTLKEQGIQALITALESVHPADPKDVLKEMEVRSLPAMPGWLAVHQDVAAHLAALDEEKSQLRVRLKEAQRRLEELRKLTHVDPTPPRFTRGLSFHLAGASGDVPVEIEYFVEAARWTPTYALHLEGTQAKLTVRALLAQASGEDWSGVQLAFSTSDLTRDATLPELQSWRMGRAQPAAQPAFRPLPEDLATLFRDYDNARSGRTPTVAAPSSPAPTNTGRTQAGVVMMEDSLEMDADESEEPVREEAARNEPRDRLMKKERAAPGMAMAMAAPMPPRGGSSTGARMPAVRPRPPQVPPRLRYAYLRLAGADEPQRGTLQPLDVLGHLQQLVDTHQPDNVNALQRAVAALQESAKALRHAPLPPGTVALEECHFHHVYDAPGSHHVASNGTYHGVGICTDEGPATLEHRTVPRASQDVFRYCVLRPTPTPYPSGPMHVYQDGSYRVTTKLPTQNHAQVIELNLGMDPDVRVLERVVHVNQEEKGLVSQTSRVEHRVRVQLLSTAGAPVRVLVYDRLPTTREDEKDIQVTVLDSTPEMTRRDHWLDGAPLKGGLVWTLTLEPNVKKDVSLHYAITLPAKTELMGGNRRE